MSRNFYKGSKTIRTDSLFYGLYKLNFKIVKKKKWFAIFLTFFIVVYLAECYWYNIIAIDNYI